MAVEDAMIISKILTTLPDTFKHFASAWDCRYAAVKTLRNLVAKLLAEKQIEYVSRKRRICDLQRKETRENK